VPTAAAPVPAAAALASAPTAAAPVPLEKQKGRLLKVSEQAVFQAASYPSACFRAHMKRACSSPGVVYYNTRLTGIG